MVLFSFGYIYDYEYNLYIEYLYERKIKKILYIYVNKCLKIYNVKYIILNIFNFFDSGVIYMWIGGLRKFFWVNLGLFVGEGFEVLFVCNFY